MIAGMFVLYGKEYVRICQLTGRSAEATEAQHHINNMKSAIDAYGWDGEWFLRAYDYYGNKVGSKEMMKGRFLSNLRDFVLWQV